MEFVRQWNTLIRHYLNVDPGELNDDEWALRAGETSWLLDQLYPPNKKGK